MRTLVFIILLGLPNIVFLQSSFNIPASLTKDANAVVRFHETTIEIESISEMTITEHWQVTILNAKGERRNRASSYENDFQSLKKMEGILYDAFGKVVRKAGKSDIQLFGAAAENEYTGNTYKYIDLEYNQFPYTVEFYTKEVVKGFFRIPSFEVNHLGESVEQATLNLITPADYAFDWKGIRTDVQPEKLPVKGQNSLKWSFANIPAPAAETQNPYFSDIFTEIVLVPGHVRIDGYQGQFNNWSNTGVFFYAMNQHRDQLSPEMTNKVRELTQNISSKRDKIAQLYHYLQDNYRYVSIQLGIGGWQTFDAAFVEKNKYGDCKALSNYMKALLKAAGITSYQALVYAGDDAPALDPELPTPLFNHVVLYVPDEEMWLECTSSYAPCGYMGAFTAGHPALLLKPDGGQLTAVPKLDESGNIRHQNSEITVNEQGQAEVHARIQGKGELQDWYRSLAREKDSNKKTKDFTSRYPVPVSELLAFEISVSPDLPETEATFHLKALNYARSTGRRIFVPLLGTHPVRLTLPEVTTRVHPLLLEDAYTGLDTFTITLPAGYQVENIAPNADLTSEYGSYSLKIAQQGQQVVVTRKVQIRAGIFPADQYAKVRQFYLDISKYDRAQVVLVKP